MVIHGRVFIKKFGKGSKSEHDAVYIETDKGNFMLRQVGANPFENTGLKKMNGKQVKAEGTMKDYLFMASRIEPIDKKKE